MPCWWCRGEKGCEGSLDEGSVLSFRRLRATGGPAAVHSPSSLTTGSHAVEPAKLPLQRQGEKKNPASALPRSKYVEYDSERTVYNIRTELKFACRMSSFLGAIPFFIFFPGEGCCVESKKGGKRAGGKLWAGDGIQVEVVCTYFLRVLKKGE